MVSLVAVIVWRTPLYVVLVGFLVFGSLDGMYLSSALTKVPNGAWFTLVLAILLCTVFVCTYHRASNFCFCVILRATDQVSRAICLRDMSCSLFSPENGHADSDIQYGVMERKISGGQKPLTGCHYLVSSLVKIMVSLFGPLS